MMKSGDYRNYVEILKRTVAQDESGQEHATYSTRAKVWAAIEPLQGRLALFAQQVEPQYSHRIRIRYLAEMSTTDRVVHGNTTYEIVAIINPDNRNEELHLSCRQSGEQ